MRRGVFFFAVFFIGLFSVNQLRAQYQFVPEPHPSQYDTLYVFDTTYIVSSFMTSDSLALYVEDTSITDMYVINERPYSLPFSKFGWYSALKAMVCDSTVPVPDGYIVGSNVYGDSKYADCFAQEYNLENMPRDFVVCGVAIKLGSGALDDYRHLTVLNNDFDTIAQTRFHTVNILDQYKDTTYSWNKGGWNLYYFNYADYDSLKGLSNFRIGFDVPQFGGGNTFRAIHTCNVYSPCIKQWIDDNGGYWGTGYNYDSIRVGLLDHYSSAFSLVRDTLDYTWIEEGLMWELWTSQTYDSVIPLTNYPDSKFIKRNGEWVNFVDDPVYEIYRNIYIAMVPIIMVPKTIQSLSEAELAKMCYLYPNPTRESFRVLSHYNIESVQVFDVSGRQVRAQSVRHFETTIDVRDLPQGTYIVKIHTSKGTDEKKLIVQ